MKISGHWDGKLLDASGVTALVEVELESSGDKLRGTFRATLLPDPEDSCGGPVRGQVTSAPVTGDVTDEGRIRLSTTLEFGGETVLVNFDARLGDPDPQALSAFFGSYDIGKGASALTLQGGSCVLWKYAGTREPTAS